jgi:hypothetical protein
MSQTPEQVEGSQSEYYINESGNLKVGPLKAQEVRAKIQTGSINGNSLAWEKGLREWKKLNDPYWEKHGLVLPDTDSKNTIAPEGDGKPKYLWKVKQTAEDSSEVRVGAEVSEGQDLYLLKIEMGWWEKLLEEIHKQDLIEELGDITYLNEQKERIVKLSDNLREKGLLEGTAGEFIAAEYHHFDKSAERVEEEVRGLSLKLKSQEFLMDFLNSTGTISKEEVFLPITGAIHSLCRNFAQDNAHRILGSDNLDIWKLFGDKYGESEDIPLLCDLVKIGNRESSSPELLDSLSSPILREISKIIKSLNELMNENGQLRKDNYGLLKELLDLTSNQLIKEMVEEKEKGFPETEIKINLYNELYEDLSQNQHPLTSFQYKSLCIKNQFDLTSHLGEINAEKNRLANIFSTIKTEDQVLNKLLEAKIIESLETCKKQSLAINGRLAEENNRVRHFETIAKKNKRQIIVGFSILGAVFALFLLSALLK